ncbi:MAG: ergothioneine biosynthesis protein EgtB [Acidobacteria bacterium]|nr:ergothioneine biosynthesis protein EgtB [Acidobacteriota bacterium]
MADGAALAAWYRRNRTRSKALFDLVSDRAYYAQPISLRHPIVFYEGHLPAFSFNTLVKRALCGPPIDVRLETLFARGIDPAESAAGDGRRFEWPRREEVCAFAAEADNRVVQALTSADLDRPGDPHLERAEAAFAILEHEAMHQETLLYMWHRLSLEDKRRPENYRPRVDGMPPAGEWIDIAPGPAKLGAERDDIVFGWDNEFPSLTVDVAAFQVARHNVTNAEFLDFVNAGGYRDPRWWRPDDWSWIQSERVEHPLFWERHDGDWHWRAMFAVIPLPPAWPVFVTHAEASAYARWRGARLPTEAEFQRAAHGTAADNVFDFSSWDPEPAGTHPASRSAWGVDDLIGNGWEWTSTVFAPFPGFRPMASYPEYSADFFDGQHFVIKGASPATARELIRPSFRNWFRPRYPYVYATFRCARDAS